MSRMKDLEVVQAEGNGQGECKRCADNGIWNRHWTSMLYKIKGMEGLYCSECVKKIKEERQ